MDGIRSWAFSTCAAAIACGLFQLLLPRTGMRKVLNATVSVFFLCCLFSPVFFTFQRMDFSLEQDRLQQEIELRSKQLETVVQDAGEALAEEKIRQEIQQVFHELGIEGGKIYIKIHEAGDGRISISECKVQLPQTYAPRHDEIQKALLQRLGERILLEYDVKSEE